MMYRVLAIIMLLCINLQAQRLNEVLDMHKDKQLHVGYTYIISSATTSYILKKTRNKKKAILIGIGTGITIGIAKEIHDARFKGAERGDIVADIAGSVMGSLIVTIPF